MGDGRICLYDAAAQAAFGAALASIADVRGVLAEAQKDLLDRGGEVLAASTAALTAAVRDEAPGESTHLLVYLPTVLDPKAPEAKRATVDRKRTRLDCRPSCATRMTSSARQNKIHTRQT